MHGEKAESEGVVMPVPYPGALVSLRWGPLLCPPLASLAFCRLQLQCAQQLRQLPGECPPREGAFGGGGGEESPLEGMPAICQIPLYEEPFCACFVNLLQHLLSALRFLNLSHNHLQDCKGFLMVRRSCLIADGLDPEMALLSLTLRLACAPHGSWA